jgi:hypothetical protein
VIIAPDRLKIKGDSRKVSIEDRMSVIFATESRRRLNLLAPIATYANENGGNAIGGEMDGFLLGLFGPENDSHNLSFSGSYSGRLSRGRND